MPDQEGTPWTPTTDPVRAELTQIANELDQQAAIAARPGQMDALERLAQRIRTVISPDAVVVRRDRMVEIGKALSDVAQAALVVKGTLTKPYPDDPRWSPWTRFMYRPTERAFNLGFQLRREYREPIPTPEAGGAA
jgi:hypothetical protein